MPIPSSPTWNLVDYGEDSIDELLNLSSSELATIPHPSVAPHLEYSQEKKALVVRSEGDLSSITLNVGVPATYTVEMLVRFARVPQSFAEPDTNHLSLEVADDASRGVSLLFAAAGVAISPPDKTKGVTVLPGTDDFTSTFVAGYRVIRIAVDGQNGRLYVFMGDVGQGIPTLKYILPLDNHQATLDRFRISANGTYASPAEINIRSLRMASGLIMANIPPSADAGPDRVAPIGQSVRFDGRASFDVEGAPLRYSWTITDAPTGSRYAADISSGHTVDDGDADTVTDKLSFPIGSLPDWVSTGDIVQIQATRYTVESVNFGTGEITLTTGGLADNLASVPFRVIRQSLLVDGDTESPYIIPDVQGIYRAELVVNDGEVSSAPAEVLANMVGARAPFGVEPDVSWMWKALGDEWDYTGNRGVFEEAWKGATQLLGAKLLEAWQHHYNYSIQDAQGTFQKKWVAYRSLIPETDPENATLNFKYGMVYGRTTLEGISPSDTEGKSFYVDIINSSGDIERVGVDSLSAGDPIGDIDAALLPYGITTAFTCLDISLEVIIALLFSSTTAFRVNSESTFSFGIPAGLWNEVALPDTHLAHGYRLTEYTYNVGEFAETYELLAHVVHGDLLVLNNGQSFRIDRVLGARTLQLQDPLPLDASNRWSIPHTVISTSVDYEFEGVYPGDLVKFETYDSRSGDTQDARALVVAHKGKVVGIGDVTDSLLLPLFNDEVYYHLVGIKRRKALPIHDETLSIPRLQDKIPVLADPEFWQENSDYILEPFYRDVGDAPIPMLQFRDEVFITPDLEPPDVFWAELTVFSNDSNIENLFGRLVGFLRDDASNLPADFNYLAGVSGLMFSQQRGPSVYAMRVGAQIMFGQPFSEVDGYVAEIRTDYSPRQGRILIRDYDGFDPPRTDVVRTYLYTKDPQDLSPSSGLDENPETGARWAVGDRIKQFSPIGAGVEIQDIYNTPDWYKPFVSAGLMTELEKYHKFVLGFNLDLVSLSNLGLLSAFIGRVRPQYTHQIALGFLNTADDIDVTDRIDMSLVLEEIDIPCPLGSSYKYDDMSGGGITNSLFDDGTTRYDGGVDCPLDLIEFVIGLDWPGGNITYDSIFAYSEQVTDVSGNHVAAGTEFSPTYDLSLPAGTYGVTILIKTKGVVLP